MGILTTFWVMSESSQLTPLDLTCRVLGCFLGGDDLQQLHLIHRGEVVHANHLHSTKQHIKSRLVSFN